MTAWWMRTTTVRKVRARSSDRLRVRAVGAAWTSAATVGEIIDVMARPGSVVAVVGHPSSARHRHARNHGGTASRHGGDQVFIAPNDITGAVVHGRGRRAAATVTLIVTPWRRGINALVPLLTGSATIPPATGLDRCAGSRDPERLAGRLMISHTAPKAG